MGNASLRHIPGNSNPADVASRGCTIEYLKSNSTWWNGPDFLLKSEDKWPADNKEVISTMETLCCYSAVNTTKKPIIDAQRFSRWTRLLRTMTVVLMFITRRSSKAAQHFGRTVAELQAKATMILFRIAQIENTPEENLRHQLGLYKCNKTALLRVRTRIQNSALPPETKEPIFLPRKSGITALYILFIHEKNHHSGTEHTLTQLRQSVWIPKARATIKRVINNRCFICKRLNAKPFKLPDFPIHPDFRVNKPSYPYENCGVDTMGPFSYKIDLQETKKCWILLFTCLNCRAISIDILRSLSSHAFLHSLRRFIATYGCPRRIICDNAPAFKTFAELQSEEQIEERSEDLLDYCATNKIDIKFIPAFSPWQGALYERMIGIFKSAFFHAVKHHTLPLDDLHTIAKESEAIRNSRPLTYTTDQTDFLPLRPADFVRPTARLSEPQLIDDECEWKPQYTTKDELLYNWQISLKLLDNFWNRWQAEYLTSLRERHQITHPHPRSYHNDNPVQGEYVLIHDENHPRGTWKMGQICGSSDNFSRSVQIRLPSKRIITRPINLISRFEIDSNETIRKETPQDESSTTRSSHPMITRSRKRQLLLPNLLSLAIMMSFLQPTTSTNTRCPDELTIEKKIIYATPCVANGIAVATYSDHDKTQLC
ncbi:unnamed protein product [Nippostrongylus brasiliensis]|uniref:Integrase catalytic domain-containing protein n=1 Tax=Nippostrongylus brasiliensis TaxID=27835 RepID=A0A0N4XYR4_NIPBR|nr:unnamed protein product [Nippostrongylus brasiliensis]